VNSLRSSAETGHTPSDRVGREQKKWGVRSRALGARLETRHVNLATHEDIDKLVEQVSTVAKTTKEIKAKISNEVWDRQKQ